MSALDLQEVEREYQTVLTATRQQREQVLARRCQAIAEAHDVDGQTYEQIADQLGLHYSRVIRLAAKHRREAGRNPGGGGND